MWWNVRRHPDRDSGRTVEQQIGNPAGQHNRFLAAAVIVGLEGDGPGCQVVEDFDRQCVSGGIRCTAWPPHCHHRSNRSFRCRRSAAFAVKTAGPSGPGHRKSSCRRADGNYPSRRRRPWSHLRCLDVWSRFCCVHRIQNPALHRLQSIADIGQGAAGDHRQRIIQIPGLSGQSQGYRETDVRQLHHQTAFFRVTILSCHDRSTCSQRTSCVAGLPTFFFDGRRLANFIYLIMQKRGFMGVARLEIDKRTGARVPTAAKRGGLG